MAGFEIISPAKLPAPWDVVNAEIRILNTGVLVPAILASLQRIGIAAIFMLIVGIPVGIAMGAWPTVNAFLSPLVDPFRSAPIVAIIPILVMWFGIGETMRIVFLWLGAVVYLIPMVRDSIKAVDPCWNSLAQDRGATSMEALFTAIVPMASPRIADSIITSVSVMWTYITVAELVNAQSGLGKLIESYKKVSQMDAVVALILTIMALALITYQLMRWLRNWKYDWEAN